MLLAGNALAEQSTMNMPYPAFDNVVFDKLSVVLSYGFPDATLSTLQCTVDVSLMLLVSTLMRQTE
jgi:hypothetical protein